MTETESQYALEEAAAKKELAERLAALPKPVIDAITSTDIEAEMRKLADHQKLHVDQWEALENSVLFTLLGVERAEDLEAHLKERLDVGAEAAKSLAADISRIVFEPIREHLETNLHNPNAKAETVSDMDTMRTQILAQSNALVAPATPPATPPTEKVARAPISAAYKAGEPSSARPTVADDPYREPPA